MYSLTIGFVYDIEMWEFGMETFGVAGEGPGGEVSSVSHLKLGPIFFSLAHTRRPG